MNIQASASFNLNKEHCQQSKQKTKLQNLIFIKYYMYLPKMIQIQIYVRKVRKRYRYLSRSSIIQNLKKGARQFFLSNFNCLFFSLYFFSSTKYIYLANKYQVGLQYPSFYHTPERGDRISSEILRTLTITTNF